MREQIRTVMRWSGPRMLFVHPVLAVRHMKEREILPQTEKWFVGDDACIVPNDGLCRIYYHIIPRTTVGA